MAVSETERSLASSCLLVQAFLDSARATIPGGTSDLRRRRRTSRTLFQDHAIAAAVIGAKPARRRDVNDRWFALFESAGLVPDPVRDACLLVGRGAALRHLPRVELMLAGQLRTFALTIVPVTPAPRRGAWIASCIEVTDSVIAARLGVGSPSLLWGGRIGGDERYFGASWTETIAGDGATGSWRDAVHPDDLARCLDALAGAAGHGAPNRVEIRLRCAPGYRRFLVSFMWEADGWWFGIANRADDAEERANRRKDEFIAVVSHELRAPLTTMMLWERVLRDESASPASHRQALDAIRDSALAQTRFVGDLLDISRAVSGKLSIDLRLHELGRLVREAFDAWIPAAHARGIELRFSSDAPRVEIECDDVRLRQVIDNLLSNAIKFTPRGGSVTLGLAARDGRAEIAVDDTGRGIASEFLGRIFEPYSQVEDELTGRHGGLGLGLAIAQRLVELHAGVLSVASDGHGRGTRAVVELPISTREGAARTPATLLRENALQELRVLVIDDEPRVSEALRLLLGGAGAEVRCAASACEAREAVGAAAPDLIVCDIAMPGEDGYSFVRWLRANGDTTPVIALTAFARESDSVRAYDAGFDVHVAKPINIERLIAVIADLHRTNKEIA